MSDPPRFKPFGLTQVYLPRDGPPTVDIVFVHGLNGHPHDSWTSKSTNCFWPVDLLPDILAPLRPRILTYGYNANVTAFTDGASRDSIVSHAETLASNLAANRNVSSFHLYLHCKIRKRRILTACSFFSYEGAPIVPLSSCVIRSVV